MQLIAWPFYSFVFLLLPRMGANTTTTQTNPPPPACVMLACVFHVLVYWSAVSFGRIFILSLSQAAATRLSLFRSVSLGGRTPRAAQRAPFASGGAGSVATFARAHRVLCTNTRVNTYNIQTHETQRPLAVLLFISVCFGTSSGPMTRVFVVRFCRSR